MGKWRMRAAAVYVAAAFSSLWLTGCTSLLSGGGVAETFSAWNEVHEESPLVAGSAVQVDTELAGSSEEEAFSLFGLPVAPTEGLSGFAYEQLAEKTQNVYAQLYTGVKDRRDHFTIRAGDTDAIKNALSALILDHPEFFWIDGNASMSGFKALGIWEIRLDFNVDAEELDGIQAVIDQGTKAYLDMIPEGASDYLKVKLAYEYIISHTDYDLTSPQNQNIQSVFLNGLSVCAGYSRALQYLLNRAGVWCTYVEGTVGDEREGHAWNLVRIDGIYTYVDPSWGDPTYGEDATDASQLPIIYDYLCLTSDEMLRAKHIESGGYWLPACTDSSFDYYRMNGLYYEGFDPDAISGALWHAVDEGEREVFLKFSDFESYSLAQDALFPPDGSDYESLLSAPIRQRMEWDSASSMRYYYSCSDELWIIKIYW